MAKPTIRFKGYTEDWEQRKLIDYLEVSSEKNRDNRFTKDDVLSVSGEYGIVNQIEFQGRSFAGASVSNYGVVENGDVVYTKSPLKSNPYGIIKTNKGIPGIVSTLYAVYKPKEITDSKFVQIYFELASRMNSYMHPLVNKGAKNDMKVSAENALKGMVSFPKKDEQERISLYFSTLDHLITLHQRKPYFWNKFVVIDWEQRKFGEITELKSASRVHKDEWTSNGVPFYRSSDVMAAINGTENEKAYISEELYEKLSKVSGKLEEGDILVTGGGSVGNPYIVPDNKPLYTKDADLLWIKNKGKFHPYFLYEFFFSPTFRNYLGSISHVGTIAHYTITQLSDTPICLPSFEEQKEVGEYFQSLDNLITLHHHKLFIINGLILFTVMQCKCHLLLNISNKNKKTIKEIKLMPELERVIEEKLIEQLVYGDSQWTYREDLKTEEDLWRNFKYILEQNNKDRLNGENLSDAEFEQVKNQLQFSSFYKAGEWLVGENGKVMVHVQRDTEKLHLVVMNHEHIAGGSSVYEVINQYSALKDEDDYYTVSRNRRFDVTLMINGLPMIHI